MSTPVVQRPATLDVTRRNPVEFVYLKGDATTPGSWRMRAGTDDLIVEKFVILTESDITLDEAKVIAIEADILFTIDNLYQASVLTDSRVDQNLPTGLVGDMTGRTITWDGLIWENFPDEWVEKGRFEDSFFSDRGIFRRANMINADPADATVLAPGPATGTTLGAWNANPDGGGFSFLSSSSENSGLGPMPFILHEPVVFAENMICVRRDGQQFGMTYFPGAKFFFDYNVGDTVVHNGTWLRCNTSGFQSFITNHLDRWDPVHAFVDLNEALSTLDAETVFDDEGHIVMSGITILNWSLEAST